MTTIDNNVSLPSQSLEILTNYEDSLKIQRDGNREAARRCREELSKSKMRREKEYEDILKSLQDQMSNLMMKF